MTRFLLLLSLVYSPLVFAVTPQSWIGGSGFGYIRTAQVLKEGESSWFLNGSSQQFGTATLATSATSSQASMGYATSMGGHTEIGLLLPYAAYTHTPATPLTMGARNSLGYLRHSITDTNKVEGFSTVFTFYSMLTPGDAAANVTSGQPSYGAELNFSHWSKNSAIHLNMGTDTTDIWDQAGTPPFASDQLTKVALGIEWGMTESVGMMVQAMSAQSLTTSVADLHVAFVVQYIPSKHWAFTLGTGLGMPSANVQGDTSVILGMSYSGNSQLRSRYSRSIDYSEQHKITNELKQQVNKLNTKLEQMEQRLRETDARLLDAEKSAEIYRHDYSNEYPE